MRRSRADRTQAALSPLVKAALAVHVAAPIGVAVAPMAWPWMLTAVGLANAACAAAGLHPRNRLLGPNVSRCGQARSVALTFDDGPDPHVTPRVLDLLDVHGARATFFCIGNRVAAAPQLTREIVRRGHRVENHTFAHPLHFGFLGPAALAREIDAAQRILTEVCGRRPTHFRAPAGVRSPFLQPVLASRNLLLTSWSRRGFDAVSKDAKAISRRLTKRLGSGEVLLLHDGRAHSRSGMANPTVLDVLPQLLEHLRASDLDCVLLEDCDDAPQPPANRKPTEEPRPQ